ncbi:MAG: Glu-tRNA(Gln) amidotransferase subunit GatE [Euryarchaeota archaeon]|nr:Glu-tRNA(Gln) amidotransferase subunit GatE [Euryarchaeota archaeon]
MSEDHEMMCGIEIHQQLDTRKLFCACESRLCDDGVGAYFRKLRPIAGEIETVDRAALAQAQKDTGFIYQCAPGATCLVDLDEEPPHGPDAEALETSLIFSELVNASVVDEIHFMRKIVVDGSNTSGYQRTALIASDGHIEVNGRRIGILSVCLEEDAARKVEDTGSLVTYRLDRLGIPLIEVATAPDMRTPEEVLEVAARLGTLLRATKRVKRGIGTIREDLNISIPGGARTEIKGAQELRLLPDYVRNEVNRQRMLLRIRDILSERGTGPAPLETADVTALFEDCGSKVIRSAVKDGGRVVAVRLPGFGGVLNGDDGALRLGAEMAQHARTKGVKGIFHSDELPGYGIGGEHVDRLRGFLGMTGDTDAFAICASDGKRAVDALTAAVNRANAALIGVPEETRDPLPDGTTRYSRPLPGAARMYPETDVMPIGITQERLESIRDELPELPEAVEKRLCAEHGINAQQARQLIRSGYDGLFVAIVAEHGMAAIAATTLLNTFSELEAEGEDPSAFTDTQLSGLFGMLKDDAFSKEAIPAILKEMTKGVDADQAVAALGLETVGDDEAAAVIAAIVDERADFVREKGMAAVGPLMGPVMGALRGRIDGKQANDLLVKEIRRLIG